MPVGKVRWYDAEKGIGFVSHPDGDDVFVGKRVLPAGVDALHKGQRVEFDFASGRKGPQALRIRVLEPASAPGAGRDRKPQHTPEELGSLVADLVSTLEDRVLPPLTAGRYPERAEGRQIAKILRVLAKDLEAESIRREAPRQARQR